MLTKMLYLILQSRHFGSSTSQGQYPVNVTVKRLKKNTGITINYSLV